MQQTFHMERKTPQRKAQHLTHPPAPVRHRRIASNKRHARTQRPRPETEAPRFGNFTAVAAGMRGGS